MRRSRTRLLQAIGTALLALGIAPTGEVRPDARRAAVADPRPAPVTDVDGNVYRTVGIGAQVWMAENLRVGHYRDGTEIPRVLDDEEWSILVSGACCPPALDGSRDIEAYGLLYNFHAVADTCGLCPEGWHVPTAAEWHALIDHLGGPRAAGAGLKATGAGHWRISVPGTTGESGFAALPAGGRGRLGGAGEVGSYATWWSSTPHDSLYAWHWGLHPDRNDIRFNPGHKASGFSVRCVRDRR